MERKRRRKRRMRGRSVDFQMCLSFAMHIFSTCPVCCGQKALITAKLVFSSTFHNRRRSKRRPFGCLEYATKVKKCVQMNFTEKFDFEKQISKRQSKLDTNWMLFLSFGGDWLIDWRSEIQGGHQRSQKSLHNQKQCHHGDGYEIHVDAIFGCIRFLLGTGSLSTNAGRSATFASDSSSFRRSFDSFQPRHCTGLAVDGGRGVRFRWP